MSFGIGYLLYENGSYGNNGVKGWTEINWFKVDSNAEICKQVTETWRLLKAVK
jgi:hypothetical protein